MNLPEVVAVVGIAVLFIIAMANDSQAGELEQFYDSEYRATAGQLASVPSDKVIKLYTETAEVCDHATAFVNAGDRARDIIQVVAICEALADEVALRELDVEEVSFEEGEYSI